MLRCLCVWSLAPGEELGLSASLLLLFLISFLFIALGVPLLYVFIWVFIGRIWDMKNPNEETGSPVTSTSG